MPDERVAALKRAFDATMRDPEFLGEAAKLRLPVTPRNGEDSRKLVEEIYGAPPELVKEGREIAGG